MAPKTWTVPHDHGGTVVGVPPSPVSQERECSGGSKEPDTTVHYHAQYRTRLTAVGLEIAGGHAVRNCKAISNNITRRKKARRLPGAWSLEVFAPNCMDRAAAGIVVSAKAESRARVARGTEGGREGVRAWAG